MKIQTGVDVVLGIGVRYGRLAGVRVTGHSRASDCRAERSTPSSLRRSRREGVSFIER